MKQRRALQLVLGLVLSAAMLSAAVAFTLNFRPLYLRDVRAYGLPAATGMLSLIHISPRRSRGDCVPPRYRIAAEPQS